MALLCSFILTLRADRNTRPERKVSHPWLAWQQSDHLFFRRKRTTNAARDLNRAVVILSKDLGQMLRWAEKRKPWRTLMADSNPADLVDVKKLIDHDYQEQRDRLLSPDEIRELRAAASGS